MILHVVSAAMSQGLIPAVVVLFLAVMGSAADPTPLNYDLARCSQTIGTVDPNKFHLMTFTSVGALECWLYCEATFRCWIASFDIINSTCSLFKKSYKWHPTEVNEALFLTISKFCMEEETPERTSVGASISEILSLSQSGTGFLIQQTAAEISCLTHDKMAVAESQEKDIVHNMKWRSCSKSSRWILKAMGHSNDSQPGEDFYQITPVEAQDLCLDAYTDPMMCGRTQAFLTKCRKILPAKEDTQLMVVRIELTFAHGTKMEKHSIYSNGTDGLRVLWTGNSSYKEESLDQVSETNDRYDWNCCFHGHLYQCSMACRLLSFFDLYRYDDSLELLSVMSA